MSTTTLLDEWNNSKLSERQFIDAHVGKNFVHIPTNKTIRVSGFDLKKYPDCKHPNADFSSYQDFYTKSFGIKANQIHPDQFLVFTTKKTKVKNTLG